MGLKSAAVARLCIREDIYRSMPDICEQYRPAGGGYGVGYAAVAPVADAGAGYAREGVVMVVEGKTGITKPCDNYDEPHHRCLKWSGAPTRVASAKPKAKPSVVASSPPPVVVTAPVTP